MPLTEATVVAELTNAANGSAAHQAVFRGTGSCAGRRIIQAGRTSFDRGRPRAADGSTTDPAAGLTARLPVPCLVTCPPL